jgi:ESF2/ABP1 family protein
VEYALRAGRCVAWLSSRPPWLPLTGTENVYAHPRPNTTAIEAATRAALLRNEISASKKEQSSYLAQVERAKNHTKAQEKKRARLERRGGNEGAGAEPAEAAAKAKTAASGKGRNFEQRQAVQQSGKGVDAALGSVLDSLF